MNVYDLIRSSFNNLTPSEDLEEKIMKATHEKKSKRKYLPRLIIAAAVIVTLVISVAAAGYAGWLDQWLNTNSDPQYFKDNTQYPNVEGSTEGISVTLDKFLCDGAYVYYQVTLQSDNGFSSESYWELVHTEIAYTQPIAYIDPETQTERYDYGPGGAGADCRLDDGSNPKVRTYAVRYALNGYKKYDNCSLVLCISREPIKEEVDAAFPDGVALVELLRYEFKPVDNVLREAALEDGTKIRINSLGVGIQGYEFFGWADENGNYKIGTLDATVCGVVLKDGTRLNFLTSTLGYDERCSSEEYWNNSPLPEVINPEDVVAIFTEDAVYPLS